MLEKSKSYKIDVTELNEEELIKFQEKLFKLGYDWGFTGRTPSHLDLRYLFLGYGDISYSKCDKTFKESSGIVLDYHDILVEPEPETICYTQKKQKIKYVKPPLGLVPRFIYNENRLSDIKQAVNRMFDADSCVDVVWIEEYNELCATLKKE